MGKRTTQKEKENNNNYLFDKKMKINQKFCITKFSHCIIRAVLIKNVLGNYRIIFLKWGIRFSHYKTSNYMSDIKTKNLYRIKYVLHENFEYITIRVKLMTLHNLIFLLRLLIL